MGRCSCACAILLHVALGVHSTVRVGAARRGAVLLRRSAALLLIQLAEDGVHLLGEAVHGVLDFFRVAALAHLLEGVDLALNGVYINIFLYLYIIIIEQKILK